ncbi:ABC transporter permease [Sphaerisporangium krabiense]|uniref:ABC-type dipeptide/oligopeptide/nickel transport system permease subunit n=1 Tax=Sphaerisporangium krabiense TaxID=763782 RepID=A0A7W9DQ50_9ACTN|nr:ABC transporter permease [Sphaerisporangium krabiense]MBB5627141.1 ABC-type dipeptide/oligopeptide/nickel transport system permease subunit [Sphaerisporangium krabiense]GII65298.1 ABC transporter permease [Sphaerisporangium krabiense]
MPSGRALALPARTRAALPPAGLVAVALIAAACVAGPWVLGLDPNLTDPAASFAPPGGTHWLGTDELGRDMLARLLYGGRLSLAVAAGGVAIAFALGTSWGVLAARRGGVADELLMRGADMAMAGPQILFALVCVAAFGASLTSLIVITGLLLAPSSARMARAVVLGEMTLDYYTAGVAYGAGPLRLMLREVLPNTAPALASQAVINAASAMILEASLSFVGLGVQPPAMSWGVLLQQGYGYLYSDPKYAVCPAVAILATILCLNLAADRLGGAARRAAR